MNIFITELPNRVRFIERIELPMGGIIQRDHEKDFIDLKDLLPFVGVTFALFYNGEHTQNCTLTYVDNVLFKYNINSFSNPNTYCEYSK